MIPGILFIYLFIELEQHISISFIVLMTSSPVWTNSMIALWILIELGLCWNWFRKLSLLLNKSPVDPRNSLKAFKKFLTLIQIISDSRTQEWNTQLVSVAPVTVPSVCIMWNKIIPVTGKNSHGFTNGSQWLAAFFFFSLLNDLPVFGICSPFICNVAVNCWNNWKGMPCKHIS